MRVGGVMTMVIVLNLATGEEQVFSCHPRKAVMAAFAQGRNDFNTWEYEKRYGSKVRKTVFPGRTTWNLGDFAAIERVAEVES